MRRITGLGVVSFAKLMGFVGMIVGLIIGLMYGGIVILITLVGGIAGGEMGIAGVGIVGGIVVIVTAPIMYGISSFVFGLLYGLVLNFALSKIGGLEIRIE